MVLVKMFTPEPTDWNPSYSKNDKIPFGSYILFDLMEDIFLDRKIETTNLPFYNITRERKLRIKTLL